MRRSMTKPITTALFLVCLMFLSTVPTANAQQNSTVSVVDGRIIGFISQPDIVHQVNATVVTGEWLSVTVNCGQCTATISIGEQNISTTETAVIQADSSAIATLEISSDIAEMITYTFTNAISEDYPTVRPAPSESIAYDTGGVCESQFSCMESDRGHLAAISVGELNGDSFISGILDNDKSEYVALEIEQGDSLEVSLIHSTADLEISAFFQNSTNEIAYSSTIYTAIAFEPTLTPDPVYWVAEDDGRIILKVDSASQNTAWVVARTIHKAKEMTDSECYSLTYGACITGHSITSTTIDWNETNELILVPQQNNVTIQLTQIVDGTMIEMDSIQIESERSQSIFAYPNASAAIITIEASVFWLDMYLSDYSDFSSGNEAPSLLPMYVDSDNSSYPILPIDELAHHAELTLSVHDISDVYKIEIDAWEDSLHLIQITAEGDVQSLQLEMWDIDQETWLTKDYIETNYSNGKLQTALQVGRGTHFVRVSLIDGEQLLDTQNSSWGQKSDSISYQLSTQYTLIDEGEQPWFPPSDKAIWYGGVMRWILGSLFLIPVLMLALDLRKKKKFAQMMASKKERLAWFKQRLDDGTSDVKTSRSELITALVAIATLDWETGLETWGQPVAQHRTENIAIAAWILDERLVKVKGSWPLIIGIHVLEGTWELAALRFDAPQGQPWNVVNVEPRFLYNGEEVFVDVVNEGSRTFLAVELEGVSDCVDIELNGKMDEIPMAARIPTTIWRNAGPEEE
ncbi:MAG: hypothetical protein NZ736_06330 [Candidatus Poseidoniaceae archaeon]|nr:hypothetical protein [Candidatus Poseidoniaceae archaeon]